MVPAGFLYHGVLSTFEWAGFRQDPCNTGDVGVVVELRSAAPDDAPRMTEIYIDSWNQGFGHLMGSREVTAGRIDRMRADVADTDVSWTVAELGGNLVGFVETGPSRDPIDDQLGELCSIAVDPLHWRQGVGRALMVCALDQLRARWTRAMLWTPTDYEQGHSFYRATGWRSLDQRRANGLETAFGRDLQRSPAGQHSWAEPSQHRT